MSCLTFTNNNPFGETAYISGTTCFGNNSAFTLNYGSSICMNIDLPLITCDNPSITGSCEPYTCCLTNGFSQIGNQYVSQFLYLDNGSILVMSTEGSYDGLYNPGVIRIDSCGQLLNRYIIPNLFSSSGSNGGFAKQSDGKIVVGMGRQTFRIKADYSDVDTTFVSGYTDGNLGITGIACNDLDEILLVGPMGSNWNYSAGTINYNTNIYKLQPNGLPDNTFSGKTITGSGGGADDSDIKKDYNTNKFILDGTSTTFGSSLYQGAVRLNNDFTLDTTFLAAGFNAISNPGYNVQATQPLSNGQYLVGGAFQNYSGFSNQDFLIRLNNDGSLDTTFDWGSILTNDYVTDIAVQSSGKIITTTVQNQVSRWNTNGSLDPTWTTGVVDIATVGLMLYPNDAVLVGGTFNTYNSQPYPRMVKLDEDGELNMCPLPTPSPTPTNTNTPTITKTPTGTIAVTPTTTATQTNTPTPSVTIGSTPTPTPSITASQTNTATPTTTNTGTPTATLQTTPTQTPSVSPTNTETPTQTATNTSTPTPSVTTGLTPTTTPTNTETPTQTPSVTPTNATAQLDITNGSLDIQITSVSVNGVTTSVIGGSLPNTTGNGTNLSTTQIGTYTIDVNYSCSVSGQHITLTDSDLFSTCINTSTGSNTATFTTQVVASYHNVLIDAQDGTC